MHPAVKKCITRLTLKEMTRPKEFMGMAVFYAFMAFVNVWLAILNKETEIYYWGAAASFFVLSFIWIVKWVRLLRTLHGQGQ